MTYKDMQKVVRRQLKQVLKIRDAGQKEYARTEDNVFANFERVSSFTGVSREQALMTYLLKHIDGIMAHINGHKSQREDVSGRITDAIVYLLLLQGMIDDGQNKRT
mgnify:FL=1